MEAEELAYLNIPYSHSSDPAPTPHTTTCTKWRSVNRLYVVNIATQFGQHSPKQLPHTVGGLCALIFLDSSATQTEKMLGFLFCNNTLVWGAGFWLLCPMNYGFHGCAGVSFRVCSSCKFTPRLTRLGSRPGSSRVTSFFQRLALGLFSMELKIHLAKAARKCTCKV